MKKMIYSNTEVSGCFFRSTTKKPNLKVLLQVTERCNLSCKHCFNSSDSLGIDYSFSDINEKIIPKLKKANVTRVTLTGGEPMMNPEIYKIIESFIENKMHVTLCTNGLLFNENQIKYLANLGNIHINVSLDGFSYESHGTFRGIKNVNHYNKILDNITFMGKEGILNGVLCSPNTFSNDTEYLELCKFAKINKASYILFNPLSKFGRGNKTQNFSYTKQQLRELRKKIEKLNIESKDFQVVFIRILKDNVSKKCIVKCGYEIPYIFIDGTVGVCPYMIFASESEISKYKKEEFLYGNILTDEFDLRREMENYKLLNVNECKNRGCIASKITNGLSIYDYDPEIYI